MASLTDLLESGPQDNVRKGSQPPKELTPGYYEWDGLKGFANVVVEGERPETWDAFLADAFPGVDPSTIEVIEPVQVRGWEGVQKVKDEDGDLISQKVKMHYYRLNVRLKRLGPTIEHLLSLVRKQGPHYVVPEYRNEGALVINTGDWQLGKIDGDGIEGAVQRITDGFNQLAEVAKEKRTHHIHLALTGDHIEGFESQGGTNAWRTQLTLTEQFRLYTRLLYLGVELLAPQCVEMTIAAVGGNHGEAKRFGNKGLTRYDDNWDVQGLITVADQLRTNPSAFSHVRTYVPAKDELTVSVPVAGTIVGHAHGHQYGAAKDAAWTWWKGQAFGGSHLADASILLAGHHHSFAAEEKYGKLFVQCPAQESESTWWRHRTGEGGNPGLI
jgi:predicted phosphodiesterase